MNPTPPNSWHGRWWSHPDLHYTSNSRFTWPAHPAAAEGPAAAAAAGAASSAAPHAGAASGAAAAEGAAAHHFAHASGGGMGGHPPPRGPGGSYHHWESRYPRRGYYGYPGGRPFFRRFFWLGVGFVGASWWFHHREHKREELERFITDPKCWSNMHNYRHLPPPPAAPPAPAAGAAGVPLSPEPPVAAASPAAPADNVQPAVPATWDDDRKQWGWMGHHRRREERRVREEAEVRAKAQAQEAAAATAAAEASSAGIMASSEMEKIKQTKEFRKLKEAVENLWANENARDYAREKLDLLSHSLDRLRESLKEEPKNSSDKKLV